MICLKFQSPGKIKKQKINLLNLIYTIWYTPERIQKNSSHCLQPADNVHSLMLSKGKKLCAFHSISKLHSYCSLMQKTSLGLCVQAFHHEMKCFASKITYLLNEIHHLALIGYLELNTVQRLLKYRTRQFATASFLQAIYFCTQISDSTFLPPYVGELDHILLRFIVHCVQI